MARDTHVAKIKPQTLYFHCASLLAQSFSNPSAIKNYWSTKDDSALRKDVGNKAEGRISNRVFQKKQSTQIFRKTNISYPLIPTRTCAYQGVRNVRFFGKFDVLCFLETPVFRFTAFCLITDEETVNKAMSYLARSTSSAVTSPLATAAICPTAAFNTCRGLEIF